MGLALELLKVSMGLVLAFGLVDLAKVLLFAAGAAYFLAVFISPLLLPAVAAATVLVVAIGFANVFLASRALKNPDAVRIGEAVAMSQTVLIDAVAALLVFSPLFAFANALTAVSLYLYAREKVAQIEESNS